jgi:hypothetical protein
MLLNYFYDYEFTLLPFIKKTKKIPLLNYLGFLIS